MGLILTLMGSLGDCLIYVVIFGATWLLYKAFIEPLLSPLRKIPGMPFNPIFGNMSDITQGEAMESSIRNVKKYGPLHRYYFMFGRERLAIADPQIIKYITTTNAKNFIKPPSRMRMLKLVLGNGLVLSEGATHANQKRVMSPAFNHLSITQMLPIFQKRVKNLIDFWREKIQDPENTNGEICVHADLIRTTLDIIGETAFGYDFKSLQFPDLEVTTAFNEIISGSGLNWRLLIPYYYKLPLPYGNRFRANMQTIKSTVNQVIEEKRKTLSESDPKSLNDCLSIMMRGQMENTERSLTDEELRDQVMTLMFAGHETTSTAMSWILLVMAEYPQVQEKCRKEILSILPQDGEITWEVLESLQYCHNVIKESLRMFPPVPLTLRQAVNDDIFLEKYFIPKGTIMLLLLGPTMRRPEVFDDPETFNPDRFNDPEVNKNFYIFLPFLIGPRMCLGHKFASTELITLLSLLLQRFKFEKLPGTKFKRLLRTTMRPDPPLKLKVSLV